MTPLLSATLLRTQSDARLVALVRQGHERAFEAIVERYRRALHRHVRRVLPESRAEDAVQQTFLKAWSSLQEGAEVRDLRPWLYRVAHNTALDAFKRSGYDYDELSESLHSPGGPELDLDRRTVIRETLAGVAALPANQREALLRTAVGGDSRAQVASDLGLTDGAVRQLLHRARAALRAAATSLTPSPMAIWAAGQAGSGAPSATRLAELGAAGGAGALLKGGAILVAAGVLVTGPVALNDLGRHHIGPDAAAADPPDHSPPPAARWVANGGTHAPQSEANGTATGGATAGGHGPTGRRGGSSTTSGGSDSSEHSGSGRDGGGGTGEGEHHGSTLSGSSGGDGHSGSGTSGTGTSGSGSGSGGETPTSGTTTSGSGESISGSGSSTEGPGSGMSGSGSSGSGSEGPGPGDLFGGTSGGDGSSETTTTTTTTTSH